MNNFGESRSQGQGSGRGLGRGGGRGRNNSGALGPGGFCVCAKCGEKVPHQQGVKCTALKCIALIMSLMFIMFGKGTTHRAPTFGDLCFNIMKICFC